MMLSNFYSNIIVLDTRNLKLVSLNRNQNKLTLLAQDVISESIQRLLNIMDVEWTSKQRCLHTENVICTYTEN